MKGRTTNNVQSKRSTKNGRKDQKLQKKNSQKRLSEQEKHVDSDPSEAYETVDVAYLDDDVTERKEKEARECINADVWEDASNGALSAGSENESPDVTENSGEHLEEEKIKHLEKRLERLEEELREVAALEISLYSVVPDHSSSSHKLHTPARRLSRIYIHACKHFTRGKRARIATNSVSGLVLVARSCGNDVSRLTFWLSNIISLRDIISQAFGKSHHTSESNGSKKGLQQLLEDWQETETFTTSLETIEQWVFSRIVESVWWQVFTPYMQSTESNSSEKQGSFSTSLWNNAFREALQRLCPVRGAGHECGCLPVLARMVMEKCISRFDVAMFNAILRESEHQIPTDPVSDPILDSKVLPIPAGELSFGSGAQLKNAIGNWSRCLTEMFGMNSEDDDDDDHVESDGKAFVLLNELSDLLMLPKDMLTESSIREEICPSITLPLIKRILCNFTPDEFCPDHVPGAVLEELNSAESNGDETLPEESFPYAASSVSYTPPSTMNVGEKVAELAGKMSRNVSMIQSRGYTSDEELEELDSPLTSIVDKSSDVTDSFTSNERYKLLRQVWV
uniref:Dilute domain-containing protein n=2 Tax=Brassica campestris TaxID=3711 RepID=M4CKE6_BRACM